MSANKGGCDPRKLVLSSEHLSRLSQNAIQRMAHTAGIPRICVKCYDTVREVIAAYLVARLSEIMANTAAKTVGFDKAEPIPVALTAPVTVAVPVPNPDPDPGPGTVQEYEFSKSGFEAVVRDLAAQLLVSNGSGSGSGSGSSSETTPVRKVRFHKVLFDELQEEVEAHVLSVLRRSKVIMDHSNRRVVYPKDIMFVVNEVLSRDG